MEEMYSAKEGENTQSMLSQNMPLFQNLQVFTNPDALQTLSFWVC